jgi:hypothetical protein
MKKIIKITSFATVVFSVAVLTATAGPPVIVVQPPPVVATPPVPPPPVVMPAPGVSVNIGVPDTYVWDGDEYVGVIGDQYYYLGPGNVWLPMTGERLTFFHNWEKHNHDWRKSATRNEKYRLDAQGHDHPWHHDHDSDHDGH